MSAQQDLYGAIQRLFSFSLQATRDDSTTVDTEKAKEDAKVKPRDDTSLNLSYPETSF